MISDFFFCNRKVYMLSSRIRSLVKRLTAHEQSRSAHKLALTCAVGVFIGISPLVGGHTLMVIVFGWVLRLNIPAVFLISVFINNPWTMVPIYSLDYFFGKWLLEALNIDYLSWDPAWVGSVNSFLERYTGISGLSLTAFLLGGHLLAFGISVMLYPLMRRIFTIYLSNSKTDV